ncbi:MAG: alpha/beta fold hydrolase [Myxococcota bacterium]
MPELPDIQIYLEALEERVLGRTLQQIRVNSPFVVRSYDPPLRDIHGREVTGLRRIGKRIVFAFPDEYFVVVHLMIAGRFKDAAPGAKLTRKYGLAAFDFDDRSLVLTEASKKKRASITAVRGEDGLADIDPGGIEVMGCGVPAFAEALRRENHTLKRVMTDPRVFSGIGNAYSDEILFRARLSPIKWTRRLTDDEIARLYTCTQVVLQEWIERFRAERKGGFPTKVTAFRKEMAVHGKYRQPCPECDATVQRIVRGESEVNYCPACQTGGKLLADRALSRLLRGDWPKTLEELEERKARFAAGTDGAPSSSSSSSSPARPKSTVADRIAALNRGRPTASPAATPSASAGPSSKKTARGTSAKKAAAAKRHTTTTAAAKSPSAKKATGAKRHTTTTAAAKSPSAKKAAGAKRHTAKRGVAATSPSDIRRPRAPTTGEVTERFAPVLVFAPGAGKPASSAWMQRWAHRLRAAGAEVQLFDYPYAEEGRRRPDRQDVLINRHRRAVVEARRAHPERRVVLIGKSMGGRIGCHLVAMDAGRDDDAPPTPTTLVCLGYPLIGAGKTRPRRDEVLLALPATARVLFVQGTRDPMCPLEELDAVRGRMAATSSLYVVDAGNHSLEVTKTWLKTHGGTQEDVDAKAGAAILGFVTPSVS